MDPLNKDGYAKVMPSHENSWGLLIWSPLDMHYGLQRECALLWTHAQTNQKGGRETNKTEVVYWINIVSTDPKLYSAVLK